LATKKKGQGFAQTAALSSSKRELNQSIRATQFQRSEENAESFVMRGSQGSSFKANGIFN
jgi:hypothetical protein